MNLEEYVAELIRANGAVGSPQIEDLIDLCEGLSMDQYNKYEIAEMLIKHMQKYYGFST